MRILVTGGAGYIGSHVVRALLGAGHELRVLDNLSAGHPQAVPPGVQIERVDLLDRVLLRRSLAAYAPDVVVHLAGKISVGESMRDPGAYFANNASGTFELLEAMRLCAARTLVFSSTSEVYGEATDLPLRENHPLSPVNPYGQSKLMAEQAIAWHARRYDLRYVTFRYFNAAGAANDGSIGEDHQNEEHLIPNALRAALGLQDFHLTCGQVDTPDGTTIRDYVHVQDIADAHLVALGALETTAVDRAFNLGLGRGYSTLQVLQAVQEVTRAPIAVAMGAARLGEPPAKYAAVDLMEEAFRYRPRRDLKVMLQDALAWHRTHPDGYGPEVVDRA